MAKQRDVWLLGSHIGTLSRVHGRLGFEYSAQWLHQAGAGNGVATGGATGVAPASSPLSQPLPLRAESFDDRAARKMAMKIGGKYRFTEVRARHWEQFARDAGLSPAQVKRRILKITRRLPDLARGTQARFEAQADDHPILGQIVALTAQRCDLTIRRLTTPAADAA